MIRRSVLTAVTCASVLGGTGCAFTVVRKSTLRDHRLPADSVQIDALQQQTVALQQQITTLQAKCQDDSARYAKLKAMPDSVLHARDQEIGALKEQISQLTAELERIKRRLASPKS